MKNSTNVAILFEKINVKKLIVFIPTKVMLGSFIKEDNLFKEEFTNNEYESTDLAIDCDVINFFNLAVPLWKLCLKYRSTNIKEIFDNYLLEILKKIYYYDFKKRKMVSSTTSELEVKHNIKITYTNIIDTDDLEEGLNFEDIKNNLPKISQVCEEIKKSVISQDDAIKKIVLGIYQNLTFDDPKMKSNIFIYGPTGVGKTFIVNKIAEIFKLPVLIEDVTRYTSAGYKGGDIENILLKLYYNANEDIDLAERSILVLDEIDKKASKKDDQSSFQKEDVLKSLLKIIEGGIFDIELDDGSIIDFDTSKLTVITCGAFSELYENDKNIIGFDQTKNSKIVLSDEKFVKYGIPVEFMGRMNILVGLNSLILEDFVKILKESKENQLKINVDSLKTKNIDIKLSDKIYEIIAKKAIQKKVGARALKTVVDSIFEDIMYDIFDNDIKCAEIEIDDNTIDNSKAYKITPVKRRIKSKRNIRYYGKISRD